MIHTQQEIIRRQEQITRTQATSNLILRDIKQLVNRMEDVMRNRAPLATKGNDSLIAEILPLRTIQAIKDFEALQHDTDEAVTQFVSFTLICLLYKVLSKLNFRIVHGKLVVSILLYNIFYYFCIFILYLMSLKYCQKSNHNINLIILQSNLT